MTEEERALAAFRAMREGGAKGGKAKGASKARSREHYAAASLKASIARAHARGLHLYDVSGDDFEARIIAEDANEAKQLAHDRNKRKLKGAKLTAKRLD